jgi:1-deoxy-D-xylulose-5-phosphate reductoisomerase
MKRIALLGMSGSIGDSTLKIIDKHRDDFCIAFASVHNNIENAIVNAHKFNIPIICITGNVPSSFNIADYPDISFYYGQNSLLHLLKNEDYDICLNAVTGSAGLPYTIEVINRGIDLALANKESLVMAGHLVKDICRRTKSKILPVDSEHSAIFQCLFGHSEDEIKKLHITASGGPFKDLPLESFKDITLEQALKHPTWAMGTKVTLDSATMFNKALEVIEAHWLFEMDFADINAVIHPQSIIHSMVEFVDGSILAQMSVPTMELPILYALSYPKHIKSDNVKTNLLELKDLTFREIEKERYPLFYTAVEAGKAGGLYPTIMNSANEAALNLYLSRKIHFTQIPEIVKEVLDHTENIDFPDLEEIIESNTKIFMDTLKKY